MCDHTEHETSEAADEAATPSAPGNEPDVRPGSPALADRFAEYREGAIPKPLPHDAVELTANDGLVDWLSRSRQTIAFTTYNSGKLVVVSSNNGDLQQACWKLARPMGIAVSGDRLGLVARGSIATFARHDLSSATEFRLRDVFITGRVDAHDVAWGKRGLYFVNTRFNCIARPSHRVRFLRSWQPSFVSGVVSHDACHLNGLGMLGGVPAMATAFGETAEHKGWKQVDRFSSGVMIDIRHNEIAARGLCMPHSPRFLDGQWLVCNSGEGALCRLDDRVGVVQVVAELPGFTRGLCIDGSTAVVGLSRIRPKHVLDAPPLRDRCGSGVAGVALIDLSNGRTLGRLTIQQGGREVYEVACLRITSTVRFR